ncbi:MAG: hypothetical protein AAF613_02560 [Pseudomonadota bacterium]
MKTTSALAIATLALAGTACSEASEEAARQPVSAEHDGFNLPEFGGDLSAETNDDGFNLGEPVFDSSASNDGFNLQAPPSSISGLDVIPGLEEEGFGPVETPSEPVDDSIIRLDP